jgi:hypothetical protein
VLFSSFRPSPTPRISFTPALLQAATDITESLLSTPPVYAQTFLFVPLQRPPRSFQQPAPCCARFFDHTRLLSTPAAQHDADARTPRRCFSSARAVPGDMEVYVAARPVSSQDSCSTDDAKIDHTWSTSACHFMTNVRTPGDLCVSLILWATGRRVSMCSRWWPAEGGGQRLPRSRSVGGETERSWVRLDSVEHCWRSITVYCQYSQHILCISCSHRRILHPCGSHGAGKLSAAVPRRRCHNNYDRA